MTGIGLINIQVIKPSAPTHHLWTRLWSPRESYLSSLSPTSPPPILSSLSPISLLGSYLTQRVANPLSLYTGVYWTIENISTTCWPTFHPPSILSTRISPTYLVDVKISTLPSPPLLSSPLLVRLYHFHFTWIPLLVHVKNTNSY